MMWTPQAAEIAREAGARLREFFVQGVATEYKGDVDLVTVADRTVEKLIRTRLGEAFPEHGIYGEEGTRERMEQEFRWYVDPLDGTTNFAHGFPQFCVSMGLEQRGAALKPDEDGTIVAAVIYDPMRDELFTAERGRGATLNGKPLQVSKTADTWRKRWWRQDFPAGSGTRTRTSTFTTSSHCVRMGCGGPDRRRWIWPMWRRGRLEAFWEFNLNPWDTAAGVLLVTEAGGRVTDFAGGPFRLDSQRGAGDEWADSRGNGGDVRGYVCRARARADSVAGGVCGNEGTEGEGAGIDGQS